MSIHQIWKIAQADFKERSRRFSFIAFAALAVLAAFWAVPRPGAVLTSITVNPDYFSQGTHWSWIPMAAAMCTGMLLPLIGFFYVRNSLTFDKKAGVANLLYASPLRKTNYLAGKYLSNLLLLFSILLVISASSICMSLIHFPGVSFSIVHFLSFFASIIPGIFFCAAIALLFEALPVFQTRAGNGLAGAIFLALFITCITFAITQPQSIMARFLDIAGFTWLKESIDRAVQHITGNPAQILRRRVRGPLLRLPEHIPPTYRQDSEPRL